MKKFNLTKVSCDLTWTQAAEQGFAIHEEMTKKHYETFENDYDYLGNFEVPNLQSILELPKKDMEFSNGRCPVVGYRCAVNDELLKPFAEFVGYENSIGSFQNLLPYNFVGAHFDPVGAHFNKPLNERTSEVDKKIIYWHLKDNYEDFETKSIDDFMNVSIFFLEPWYHGQAFMMGRQVFSNWKQGDVISFPWYMEHSTANLCGKNRNILYLAGNTS